MSKNIKLLEDLVSKAAIRISELSEERKGLKREVSSLKKQLAAAKRESDPASGTMQVRQDEVVSVLRETLSDLRD